MTKRDIIVIGASAGGVNALISFVKSLPEDFNACIFVVLHLNPSSPSNLPHILTRFGPVEAVHPIDNENIKPGKIYIAPPDHHLLLERDRILVRKGPKENRFRPSIDALFRSAAYVYGPRVIGIVLSGLLNDGTSGMWSVKRMGGVSIVQDPQEALFESMPLNVLEYVDIDYKVPVAEMGILLQTLINQNPLAMPDITAEEMKRMNLEVVISANKNAFELGILSMGDLTPFTCPECNGTLIKLHEGKTVRYRCHTGHAFTASALLAGITQSIEEQFWSAMRSMEEATMLLEIVGNNFKEAGNFDAANKFLKKAQENREKTRIIRGQIVNQELISEDLRHEKDSNGLQV